MRTRLKKRGASLSILLAFALVVAACGGDGDDTTTTGAPGETTTTAGALPGEDVQVGMAYDIGGRGDQSFNDSAAAGLDRAVEELGIQTQELEPTGGGEDRGENLVLLGEAGMDLVFAIGFAFAESVTSTAPEFPETTFGIVDSVVEAPNVVSLVFAEHQGSALVGCAAALKTETGTVGFVGGVSGTGLIERFEAGYIFGVEECGGGDVEVTSTYLTVAPDFSGFTDAARGREAALGMYDTGADIVYHAAGGSGAGVFEAAAEVSDATGSKVWGIGVDSDQYNTIGEGLQEYVLTSMLKRVDVAVFNTIDSFVAGDTPSGTVVFDLSVDGVGYSTSGGFIDDITDQLEDLKARIVSGEVTVPDA